MCFFLLVVKVWGGKLCCSKMANCSKNIFTSFHFWFWKTKFNSKRYKRKVYSCSGKKTFFSDLRWFVKVWRGLCSNFLRLNNRATSNLSWKQFLLIVYKFALIIVAFEHWDVFEQFWTKICCLILLILSFKVFCSFKCWQRTFSLEKFRNLDGDSSQICHSASGNDVK